MPPKRVRKSSISNPHPAKKVRAAPNTGRFVCPICKHGFSRRTTVRDTHFPSCVRKNGNPAGVKWNQHESCKGRAREDAWPSGRGELLVGGGEEGEEEREGMEETQFDDRYGEMEVEDQEMGEGNGEAENEGEVADESLPDMMEGVAASEASTDVEDNIVMHMPSTSDTRVASSDARLKSSPAPGMKRGPHGMLYETPRARITDNSVPNRRGVPPSQKPRFMISNECMIQIANIAFMACREEAGISDVKAMEMYDMWYRELPSGHTTRIARPEPGCDVKSRQQAVVWIAQDVYSALTSDVQICMQQLHIASVCRNITSSLGNFDGVRGIHELVKGQLGPNGTMLLSFPADE